MKVMLYFSSQYISVYCGSIALIASYIWVMEGHQLLKLAHVRRCYSTDNRICLRCLTLAFLREYFVRLLTTFPSWLEEIKEFSTTVSNIFSVVFCHNKVNCWKQCSRRQFDILTVSRHFLSIENQSISLCIFLKKRLFCFCFYLSWHTISWFGNLALRKDRRFLA